MKKFLKAIWNFLESWGEYRYRMAKGRDFRY
jgi:hypothetical protein